MYHDSTKGHILNILDFDAIFANATMECAVHAKDCRIEAKYDFGRGPAQYVHFSTCNLI